MKNEELKKKWVTTRELMVYLGVSEEYIKDLRDTASIPFYKLRRKVFYKLSEIDRLIENGKVV